jgi:hypothetical protein
MAGGCGIEEHMIKGNAPVVSREELGELVERGDVDGTSAGELLA